MREREIKKTKNDYKHNKAFRKNSSRDSWIIPKLVILLGILTCYTGSIASAPARDTSSRPWPFPQTWRCASCGYENYEGINYCGMCGARR